MLTKGQIFNISVYLESNDIPKVPFGERASAYPGKAPLGDILQAEIGEDVTQADTGDILQAKMGNSVQEMREDIDWDAKTLVEGGFESGKPKTTVRGGKMLVTGKIRCLAGPAVLMNIKVSGSGEIRDKLRLLVRDHLDGRVSLLELDYQPFKI